MECKKCKSTKVIKANSDGSRVICRHCGLTTWDRKNTINRLDKAIQNLLKMVI